MQLRRLATPAVLGTAVAAVAAIAGAAARARRSVRSLVMSGGGPRDGNRGAGGSRGAHGQRHGRALPGGAYQ